MINLIPEEARKKMVTEYWFRVASVWMFVLSGVCMLVSVAMIPTYVLVDGQESAFADSALLAREEVSSFDDIAKDIVDANTQAQLTIAHSKRVLLSTYFKLIDSLAGESISLEGYSFTSEEGVINSIQTRGTARDRQALASFRDSLRNQDSIAEVDLPLSNLAQDRNIPFVITISPNAI
jgi:hypothetical protein